MYGGRKQEDDMNKDDDTLAGHFFLKDGPDAMQAACALAKLLNKHLIVLSAQGQWEAVASPAVSGVLFKPRHDIRTLELELTK